MTFGSLLSQHTVAQVIAQAHKPEQHFNPPTSVIHVQSSQTVEASLSVLLKHKINAAPILDEATGNFIGMVGMADLVEYVLALRSVGEKSFKGNVYFWRSLFLVADPVLYTNIHCIKQRLYIDLMCKQLTLCEILAHFILLELENAASSGTNDSSSSPARSGDNNSSLSPISSEDYATQFLNVVRSLRALEPIPVTSISDLSKRDPLMLLQESDTLLTAIKLFAKGVHRALVTKGPLSEDQVKNGVPKDMVVAILSQSDVLRFFEKSLKSWGDVMEKKLNDLKLSAPKSIISVPSSATVLQALQSMHDHRISSVAVVDNGNKLLGCISVTDVKYVLISIRRGVLSNNCAQFINKIKTTQMLENEGKDTYPAIQTSATISLSQLIRLLVVTHIHRIYITNSDTAKPDYGCAMSVVSLSDIMGSLVKLAEQ
ncbi:hypothetical protein BKA69DRAFT_1039642 [Paraphysoderma sedebokerense]|nr:hypothetical protein BKA69DRAFT_1039642 [Paraphysoderma sedebokerense]